jgi:hypothetical protein
MKSLFNSFLYFSMPSIRCTMSVRPEGFTFMGYSGWTPEVRGELLDKIFGRMNVVYAQWVAGEYTNLDLLEDLLTDDKKIRYYQTLRRCVYNVFTGDRAGDNYPEVTAYDWLCEELMMTTWPQRDSGVVPVGMRSFSSGGEMQHVGDFCPVPVALPVALPVATVPQRYNPSYWTNVATQIQAQSIPVLEPIRRVKRHNVRDLEELSASEESDLEPVALPVEPVVRRSKRVRVQRQFYYGY